MPSSAQYETWIFALKRKLLEGRGGGVGVGGGGLHNYTTMEFNRADFTLFK